MGGRDCYVHEPRKCWKEQGICGRNNFACSVKLTGRWVGFEINVITPMLFWLKPQSIVVLLFFSRPPDPRSSTPEECLH